MSEAASYLVGDKKLGVWAKTVQKIGFEKTIVLILLAGMLTLMGTGGGAVVWILKKVADSHLVYLDRQANSTEKMVAITERQTKTSESAAKAAWEHKRQTDQLRELTTTLVESDKLKNGKLDELIEVNREVGRILREKK